MNSYLWQIYGNISTISAVDCRTQASRRAQQCTVAADVHVSSYADSEVTDDVISAGSCRPSARYCSATVGSFRRRDRLRSSLPIVSAMNKSLERPLGESRTALTSFRTVTLG